MGLGLGKAFKKTFGKVINTVTGGNATLNKVIGLGLAPVTGGSSLSAANQVNRTEAAKEARKAAAQEAAAEAQAADKANRGFIAQVNQQRQALLDRTKTDYTGDLTDDDEDSEETINKLLSRPLVIKRRKLLDM